MQRINGIVPIDVHEGLKDNILLKFLMRVKLLFSIFILSGILIMAILVYYPLHAALTESTILNFSHLVEAKQVIVQNDIDRSLDGSRSMSSRTMIRENIVKYLNQEISYDEMEAYVGPRYEDGAKALTNLILAERIIGDRVLTKTVFTDDDVDISDFFITSKVSGEEYKTIVKEDMLYMGVTTPVIHEGVEVARDFLIFNLSIKNALLTGDIQEVFMERAEYEDVLNGSLEVRNYGDIEVIETFDKFYGTTEIDDGIYMAVIESRRLLLKDVERISTNLLIGAILTLLGAILLIYLLIIRYAKNELSTLTICKVNLNKAESEANIDSLTGAHNRRYAETRLRELFETYKSTRITPLIAMLDIDGFKSINDTYGHNAGDEVLKAVVEAINRTIREDDIIMRWGGDEFIIVAHGLEKAKARDFFMRLYEKINEERIEARGEYVKISISVGAGFFEENDESFHDAINRADMKMYGAKEEEGNSFNI